jgi:hypothetical protein
MVPGVPAVLAGCPLACAAGVWAEATRVDAVNAAAMKEMVTKGTKVALRMIYT